MTTIRSIYEEKFVTKYGPADAPVALLRKLRSAHPRLAFGFDLAERDEKGNVYLDYAEMLIDHIKDFLVELAVARYELARGISHYESEREAVESLHAQLRGRIGVVSLSFRLRQEPTVDYEA